MPSPSEPTALDRARAAVARGLGRLPSALLTRLAGGPVEVEGQRLDPALALLFRLNPRDDAGRQLRERPVRSRRRLRREALALTGPARPVGEVRGLTVDGADGPLAARLYTPADADPAPLVVFFHGGGYVEGDLDTHDGPCRVLCREARQPVLSVAYRLAPEHPFPAAVDDALAAFRWAQRHHGPGVAVGGDSAGGQLAAVVAQAARDERPPVAQLLIYPATDPGTDRPSRHLFDGWLLPEALRAAYFDVYTRGTGAGASDPRLAPLRAERLDGLAPALVVTAGFDVLRDEGEAYAHALGAAGTPVALHRQPDLTHGFLNLTSVSPAARRATTALARRWRTFLAEHA